MGLGPLKIVRLKYMNKRSYLVRKYIIVRTVGQYFVITIIFCSSGSRNILLCIGEAAILLQVSLTLAQLAAV